MVRQATTKDSAGTGRMMTLAGQLVITWILWSGGVGQDPALWEKLGPPHETHDACQAHADRLDARQRHERAEAIQVSAELGRDLGRPMPLVFLGPRADVVCLPATLPPAVHLEAAP